MDNGLKQQTLEIKTLGSFSVCVGGEPLAYDSPRAGLMWKLFKFIITNRSGPIPTERIIDALWPDDEVVDNPLKALYTLMYRLRNELSRLYAEKQEFITFRQNTYTWNKTAPYSLDVEDFEENFRLAENETLSDDERITYYKAAFELYGGDYLAESLSESWVLPQSTYLKRIYVSVVGKLCELYKSKGSFEEIVRVCERAIALDPLEDAHHILLIEALIQLKQLSQALAHYDYIAALLYNELGIQPSEKLQSLYKQIHQSTEDAQYDIDTIMEHLAEKETMGSGAFFCDLDVFHKIYQLESRALERSGQSVYLACMMFSTPAHKLPGPKQLNEAVALLKKVTLGGLRRGDVVTQYSKSQLLLMIPSNSYENCEKVIARLRDTFFKQYIGDPIELTFTFRPVPAR